MDMAHATFDALRKFGRRNGCECNGEPDWKTVQDFIDVGYPRGSLMDFTNISKDHLRRKIELLGVPWRSSTGLVTELQLSPIGENRRAHHEMKRR